MTESLTVHLFGEPVGRLSRNTRGDVSFAYDEAYAAGPGPALSPALPLGDETFTGTRLRAYLEGLLPDDQSVRQRWARQFGVVDEPFDLLTYMGLDCVGAVQFAAPGEPIDRSAEYVPITDAEIGERIRGLRADGSTWALPDEQWSLPGAQEKFAVARRDNHWYEALGAAPTTHIIKPGIAKMRHQAEVEFATMRAAQRLGLTTAAVEMLDVDGETALAVRRFDRSTSTAGLITRWHQVDLCQALGVPPSRKYEASGGPTTRQLADLLRRVSSTPEADVRRLSDAMLFNYLSGCPDGHAKNFSLLFAGRQTRLAPLYDLATGLAYGSRDAPRQAAFSLGGVRNFGESYPKHWRAHARDVQLDEGERVERVRELAAALPDAFQIALTDDLGGSVGLNLWERLAKNLVPACHRIHQRWQSHR
ncbi:MAG: type II toxin-antitoxin system HipA family toxin [Humibacillus sp.]|nr:type II toxin-antitoxin system HipA family toxin [Humibacillus sp.]MDN5775677.1 type II toxin-antitoxin system HipA family toxin [Humibacillus sp.]